MLALRLNNDKESTSKTKATKKEQAVLGKMKSQDKRRVSEPIFTAESSLEGRRTKRRSTKYRTRKAVTLSAHDSKIGTKQPNAKPIHKTSTVRTLSASFVPTPSSDVNTLTTGFDTSSSAWTSTLKSDYDEIIAASNGLASTIDKLQNMISNDYP